MMTCLRCAHRMDAWRDWDGTFDWIGNACDALVDETGEVQVFRDTECPCDGERFEEE